MFYRFSRTKDFGLVVALSSSHVAEGALFWDDGETLSKLKLCFMAIIVKVVWGFLFVCL